VQQDLGRTDSVTEYAVLVNRILGGLVAMTRNLEGAPLVGDTAWGRVQQKWETAREEAEAWEKEIAAADPPRGLEELHKCVLGHQRMHQAAALAGLHYLTAHTWLHLAGKTASLLRSGDPSAYGRLNLSGETEVELSKWGDPNVGVQLGIF
jgi:hypothetical protein